MILLTHQTGSSFKKDYTTKKKEKLEKARHTQKLNAKTQRQKCSKTDKKEESILLHILKVVRFPYVVYVTLMVVYQRIPDRYPSASEKVIYHHYYQSASFL